MESGGSNESLPAGLTDRPIRPGGASPSQVALRVFFFMDTSPGVSSNTRDLGSQSFRLPRQVQEEKRDV